MGLFGRIFGGAPPVIATELHAQGWHSRRTFAVSDVTPATDPLPLIPFHQAVSNFLGGEVESCSTVSWAIGRRCSFPSAHRESSPRLCHPSSDLPFSGYHLVDRLRGWHSTSTSTPNDYGIISSGTKES